MPADLSKPFAESCCEGGTCDSKLSTQPCGCDPGMDYHCSEYSLCGWGRYESQETIASLASALDVTPESLMQYAVESVGAQAREDAMRETVPALGWVDRQLANTTGARPVAEYRAFPADGQTRFASQGAVRTFDSGATRNIDNNKFDYEGFVHPEALHAFAEYMHTHRKQRDGTIRDSDNWQKGIPFRTYVKSLVRHAIDLWRMERGFSVTNPDTGQPHTKQELCCAIVFNSMGYLKELLDPAPINVQKKTP